MNTTLILVRHGETTWNEAMRFQGQSDTEMNARGREQARSVALRLADEAVAAVFSSDLKRARETAERIAQPHGLPVSTDPRLREVFFGEWEGLQLQEVRERDPDLLAQWWHDSFRFRPPGGERLDQVRDRMCEALREAAGTYSDRTVVVVSHGGPIKAAICELLKMNTASFSRIRIDNGGLTTFRVSGSLMDDATLEALNDTCHASRFTLSAR